MGRPGLIWTYALADASIGLAYFSIPLALAMIVRRTYRECDQSR
jgi:hypothetical protein